MVPSRKGGATPQSEALLLISCYSVSNLQAELNAPGSACSNHRICAGYIRRCGHQAKCVQEPEIIIEQNRRVGKIWMIQNVEDLRAELSTPSLGYSPGLHQREVPILELRSARRVSTAIPKVSGFRLCQYSLNRHRSGSREVRYRLRISDHIPAIAEFASEAGVILEVDAAERSTGLKSDD